MLKYMTKIVKSENKDIDLYLNKFSQYNQQSQYNKYNQEGGAGITYVISSHGGRIVNAQFILPKTFRLVMYVKEGDEIACEGKLQSYVCSNPTGPVFHHKTGTPIPGVSDPNLNYIYGGQTVYDYLLSPDNIYFKSGLIKCNPGGVNEIFPITETIKLSNLIKNIVEKNIIDGTTDQEIFLHCLFCRGDESINDPTTTYYTRIFNGVDSEENILIKRIERFSQQKYEII